MTPSVPNTPRLDVTLAGRDQEPVLANLLELYAHDFSEFHEMQLGDDGRFGYRPLPLYWSDPDRHPFLVKVDGKIAGLVLVKKGSEVSGRADVWDMVEFFVVRGCRRRGIGTRVAHSVWNMFPGPWEIRVQQANASAQRFWAGAVSTFVGREVEPGTYQSKGKDWIYFSLESMGSVTGSFKLPS